MNHESNAYDHAYESRRDGGGGGSRYVAPPNEIPGISGLSKTKPKTSVQGGGGLRKRRKDADGNIYERDSRHGALEKYNSRGKHLGAFNPETGKQLKGPNPNYSVEP